MQLLFSNRWQTAIFVGYILSSLAQLFPDPHGSGAHLTNSALTHFSVSQKPILGIFIKAGTFLQIL